MHTTRFSAISKILLALEPGDMYDLDKTNWLLLSNQSANVVKTFLQQVANNG